MASLAELLASGDPEAAGAANASQAMEPAVTSQLAQALAGLKTNYDPNRSFAQNALDPQGIEQAMGIGLGFSGGGLGIKAYHASPHDFDKFDISKIGSGQGAQSFGHGVYAAESPAVSGPKGSYDMEFTARNMGKPDLNQGEAAVLRMLRDNGTDPDVISYLAQNGYSFEDALKTLNSVKEAKAKLYEVNINADPRDFLNWDNPVAGQEPVERALGKIWQRAGGSLEGRVTPPFTAYPEARGQSAYSALATTLNSPGAASQKLLEQGIPGIRYLDQGSRGAGAGTSNYVVFDPSIVEILKKYGLAGLLAGGAAGATGNGDQNAP